MEKKKISVVINTYNARKFLQRVLDSVKGSDEIVIYDMESTDHTVEIAQRTGYKVVTFPRDNHTCAGPARGFALQDARDPWLLVIDAGELVTSELRIYLCRHINRSSHVKGLYIPKQNQFMNTPKKGFSRDYQLRFFIREGTFWPPLIRTIPQVQGKVEYIDNHLHNVKLLHLAENYLADMLEKYNQYTTNEVLKRKGENYGVSALLFRPFWCFFKSYFMNGEIRSGVTDFVDSVMIGFYQFMIIAKIIESEIKRQTEDE